MLEKFLHDAAELASSLLQAVMTAALGSAVAQAYQKGLSWRDRLVQWVVGICVSFYVTRGVVAWLEMSDFVGQAIGFVLGMIAFQAAPRFIAAAGDAAATLPGILRNLLPGNKGAEP